MKQKKEKQLISGEEFALHVSKNFGPPELTTYELVLAVAQRTRQLVAEKHSEAERRQNEKGAREEIYKNFYPVAIAAEEIFSGTTLIERR
ncbi:MAG: DNA-directed RNA polymerase subunit omega [Lachnospiraceae bacterium]|nr:DNA-directed RNA polymerase subunit omega [Lachnospiraceae bacterium]